MIWLEIYCSRKYLDSIEILKLNIFFEIQYCIHFRILVNISQNKNYVKTLFYEAFYDFLAN